MDFLSKYKLTPAKVLKMVLIGIGALIALTILAKLIDLPMMGGTRLSGFNGIMQGSAPSVSPAYDSGYSESTVSYGGSAGKSLSIRNVMPILPPRPGTTGNDAESYEVTDYNALIETRNIVKTCAEVKELKTLSYVIFESVSESDKQCYYTFKVEHAHVAEILAAIKVLDPKDLTENTNTIKQQIDDFTSQTEILKKKRDSIDKTLEGALRSYDEITVLATRTQNADALAKIIDSKIGIIERLTQERINVTTQLDQLARAKEDQLDRLKYAYFNVNVYENKFFDGEVLKDSWKASLKTFVQTVNVILQSITVGLLGFLVWLLPLFVYALLALFIAKYGWRAIKYLWER